MFKRLSATDFQLKIVLLYGFFSAAIITPFAVFRFLTGAIKVGVLDSCLVLLITCIVIYGWKFEKTERTGQILVVIGGVGALMSSEMLGVVGLFWMYVAIVANFFLTKNLYFAAIFTVAIMILLAITGKSFSDSAQLISFLATGFLLSLLSYIISQQYSLQRQRLELLATVDPLTGALNRRAMENELHLAVEEHARKNTPMSVILMDLDNFKQINDNFGHDKGDLVLSKFAELVMQSTRQNDRFFRYGGEEFLMLIKNAEAEEAERIAEKIRATAEHIHIADITGITVSLGIANIRQSEPYAHWIARADTAMYRAKQLGRNRVEL